MTLPVAFSSGAALSILVHLVRHGEVHNPRALSYGRLPGFPLSDDGRRQVAITAGYLRAFGGDVEHVATSPLERAKESANIVCGELGCATPHVVDERLIEAGSWRDGLPRAIAPVAYARRYFNRAEREKAEAAVAVAERMHAAISERVASLRDGESAILISHQQPIWWAKVAFERGLDAFRRARLNNVTPWIYVRSPCDLASVTTFVFDRPGHAPTFRYFSP